VWRGRGGRQLRQSFAHHLSMSRICGWGFRARGSQHASAGALLHQPHTPTLKRLAHHRQPHQMLRRSTRPHPSCRPRAPRAWCRPSSPRLVVTARQSRVGKRAAHGRLQKTLVCRGRSMNSARSDGQRSLSRCQAGVASSAASAGVTRSTLASSTTPGRSQRTRSSCKRTGHRHCGRILIVCTLGAHRSRCLPKSSSGDSHLPGVLCVACRSYTELFR